MKKILFISILMILFSCSGYCQNTQELMGEVTKLYLGNQPSGNGLFAGYTLSGLIGGFLFASIGFIAFIFGKKNQEFKPLLIGILLMAYPYFLKSTSWLYIVGIVLTVILFIWKD